MTLGKEGKGGKRLEKENIWSAEEKMKRKGKGGKYLEKEMFGPERRKRAVKEKEENNWSSKEERTQTEKEQNILRGKIFIEGKYL